MTDDTDLLDPKHPWIDDPQDVPGRLKWLDSLVVPTGETSRVHFTRVWTALFFTRLLFVILSGALVFVLASAGVEDASAAAPPPWAFLVLVAITAVMSLVLHVRRLASARRSPLWAVLVMVPVLIAAAGFFMGTQNGARDYAVAIKADALRSEGLRDKAIAIRLQRPRAYDLLAKELLLSSERTLMQAGDVTPTADRLSQSLAQDSENFAALLASMRVDSAQLDLQKLRAAIDTAVDNRRKAGGDADRDLKAVGKEFGALRKQWKDTLPTVHPAKVAAREHAIKTGVGQAQMLWALPAFLVMLWSLLWVGRLPNGGGRIRDRFTSTGQAPSSFLMPWRAQTGA